MGAWIKRREEVNRARRIRSEKLRDKRIFKLLEEKRVESDGENNVEQMWEQVKWAMVESAIEVCGSVRMGGEKLEEHVVE